MKQSIKRKCAVILSAIMIPTLAACQTPVKESFDERLPWLDGESGSVASSYEKLVYSANIYDTSKGSADDARLCIASGTLEFELKEQSDRKFTDLSMRFTVTYNNNAAEADRGKTDTITSETEFQTSSLLTSKMTKTVSLAEREGRNDLSYTVEADYFDTHKIKKYAQGKPDEAEEMPVPAYGTFHDNEMMVYLARAVKLASGGTTAFYMSNVFDSFLYGEFTNYTMTASCSEGLVTLYMDEWVTEFGVEAVTAEDGTVSYPVTCYNTNINISADKHGPPYNVQYTEKPFVKDGKEHHKIPVSMAYPEYTGSALTRITEYKLTACSFTQS